jgi:hypothetical protein
MRLCSGINRIRVLEVIDHYWNLEAQCFHFRLLTQDSTVWMNEDEIFLLPTGQLLLMMYLKDKRLKQ